ncbi:MAG: hypothetical protein QOH76_1776 [Thermoleophilaceae bacterium]|nr:hypothetical protein [Thermoleophilaceae bacterium]
MRLAIHTHLLPAPSTDDAAARRTLRDQVARLDGELAALGTPMPAPIDGGAGANLISLAELERTRDRLADLAADRRRELDAQGLHQEEARRAREELLLDPARHRFARVTNEDVGERGCRDWHVRPRFGLLGMLAGWWRVVISSGCPLPVALAAPTPARSHPHPGPAACGALLSRLRRRVGRVALDTLGR